MAEVLLTTFGEELEALSLVPGSGGAFEVEADGQLVFSKKAEGRHPAPEELVRAIEALRDG